MSNILTSYRRNPLAIGFGDFDEIFNSFLTSPVSSKSAKKRITTIPQANITESDNCYEVSLAAPGLTRDDFNISIDSGVMTVSAVSENHVEENRYNEFDYGNFNRSWTLPESTNPESITANYSAGILNITVPTENKNSRAVTISID